MALVRCNYCGQLISADDNYCMFCGKPIRKNEQIRCEECKPKEVQETPAHKESVYTECEKPVHEYQPPKRGGNKWLYGAILVFLVICSIAWWLWRGVDESNTKDLSKTAQRGDRQQEIEAVNDSLQNNADKALQERDSLQAVADSLQRVANQRHTSTTPSTQVASPTPTSVPVSTPVPTASPKADTSVPTSGSKNLGYAVFNGTLRNGQPDDVNGLLVFKTSHIIDSRDPKGRIADPGDYVIGEFSEGHLVQGIWYDADNQVKGSILIGK